MGDNPYEAPVIPADSNGFRRRPLAAWAVRLARIPLIASAFFIGMVAATLVIQFLDVHPAGVAEIAILLVFGVAAGTVADRATQKVANWLDPR
jgi:predicted membrane protein